MTSFRSSSLLPTPSLTTIISTIPDLPPSEAIDLLSNLVPELIPSITFFGQRLISHPKHRGSHDLNDLAYKYLHLGRTLSNTNASLSSRLTHYDLHTHFANQYELTNRLFDKAAVPGFLRHCRQFSLACGCCVGYPWVVIPDVNSGRRDNAMYFEEGVWDKIWGGGVERCGGMSWFDTKTGRSISMALANKEMLVEALGRGVDELDDVGIEKSMEN
jgi:hypothetical protein